MINLSQLFDTYGRNARLQPALLTLFPVIVTVSVWFPALYTHATGLLGVAMACGIMLLLAEYARARGRTVERRLHSKLGGKHTAILLRHRDSMIDADTKDRYTGFLSQHIKGWTRPTREEEALDPAAADQRYDSAVKWLLEYTRDKKTYGLLFNENITYGFRRNTYGLKPLGITVAVLAFLANAAAVYVNASFTSAHIGSMLIALLAVLAWLFIVSEAWVRDAADTYAVRLLAACEQKSSAAPKKRQSKKADSSEKKPRTEKVS